LKKKNEELKKKKDRTQSFTKRIGVNELHKWTRSSCLKAFHYASGIFDVPLIYGFLKFPILIFYNNTNLEGNSKILNNNFAFFAP